MWQRRLHFAHLIDNLLADAAWVRIWRALRDAAGDMAAVAEILHVEPGSLRGFKDRATEAAISFNEKFHDIPPPLRTRNKKGILSAFAAEHRIPGRLELAGAAVRGGPPFLGLVLHVALPRLRSDREHQEQRDEEREDAQRLGKGDADEQRRRLLAGGGRS